MDSNGEICLGLGLGLGLTETYPKREVPQKKNKRVFFLDLSIPTSAESNSSLKITRQEEKQGIKEEDDINFSLNFGRKKLRLTRDQTTLLEDSFKQHTTLNTAQKQALAENLSLKPRQVEVWFQNRRARTKLKQTEVECEFLKKNCERLSDENRRLKKELLELRSSLKIEKPQPPPAAAAPYFRQSPKAAAHEKNGGGGEVAAAEVVHQA